MALSNTSKFPIEFEESVLDCNTYSKWMKNITWPSLGMENVHMWMTSRLISSWNWVNLLKISQELDDLHMKIIIYIDIPDHKKWIIVELRLY